MEKIKEYKETRFSPEVIKEAVKVFREMASKAAVDIPSTRFYVQHPESKWHYDSEDEFYADYRRFQLEAYFTVFGNGYDLTISVGPRYTTVSVKASSRVEIESVFEIFEKHHASSLLPPILIPTKKIDPIIFIGHGRSQLWRELKDHLTDKHGIKVEAYETGARAGHTIRDILEEMAQKSSFALIVMTAEDAQADGGIRARQNVVHEAGLFQGRLGFHRAIMVLEEGVENFSNVDGIQQIRFSRGNIKETFGEILATIRREFGM